MPHQCSPTACFCACVLPDGCPTFATGAGAAFATVTFAGVINAGTLIVPEYKAGAGAGAAFGWMRHATGSTRAATIMHASYNALFFFALFAQRKDLPHSW